MPSFASGNACCTACASTCADECLMTERPVGESAGTGSTTSPSEITQDRSRTSPFTRATTTSRSPVNRSPAVVPVVTSRSFRWAWRSSTWTRIWDTALPHVDGRVMTFGLMPRCYRPQRPGPKWIDRSALPGGRAAGGGRAVVGELAQFRGQRVDREEDGPARGGRRMPEIGRDLTPAQAGQLGGRDVRADLAGGAAEVDERGLPRTVEPAHGRLIGGCEPLQLSIARRLTRVVGRLDEDVGEGLDGGEGQVAARIGRAVERPAVGRGDALGKRGARG